MGMYDTFGSSGDQLKIFFVPCYYFSQNSYDKFKETGKEYSFLGFMGGNLDNYPIGSKVPWRSLCYNYSPNFTVVDTGYVDEPTMLYGFSNGKLLTIAEYNENNFQNYEYLFGHNRIVVNGFGALMTIKDVYMLRDYIQAALEENLNRIRLIKDFQCINKVFFEYQKLIKDDPDYDAKYENFNKAFPILNKMESNAYVKNERYTRCFFADDYNYKFAIYGGYIDAVKHYGERSDLENDLFPALMHEAKKFVNNEKLKLEDFFKWNETPEEDKEWIIEIDKKIREG